MTAASRQGKQWSELVAETPGSVLLQCALPGTGRVLRRLFCAPVRVIEARAPAEVRAAFAAVDQAVTQGLYVAGYVSYEAGYALEPSLADLATALPGGEPLVWFGCYRHMEVQEGDLAEGESGLTIANAPELQWLLTEEAYAGKVEEVRGLIEAGETYQANLTTEVRWASGEAPAALFERLFRAQPVPYAALLHPQPGWHGISLSPELFFRRQGQLITTKPMKGTASPGLDVEEARANAAWLQADAKNRAENVMIVDLLRNDLGRVCESGSIEVPALFEVERLPTVLQMTSTVRGRLRKSVTYAELFEALFPSGSIVGAPKIHTMRLLHGLERRLRGVYTGAIGYISPEDVAEFNVAIRTLTLRDEEARLGVGSGITFDSVAAQEFEECRTKVAFITRRPEPPFSLLETLLLKQASYALLGEHLERMAASAAYFGIVFVPERVRDALRQAAETWRDQPRTRVRLLMDRAGQVSWTASRLESDVENAELGLLLVPERTDASDRFLRHKTTWRGRYDDALHKAQSHGFADALFCNTREEVTEGAIHNVVVVSDGQGWTPPLACGVLPGTYRKRMLEDGRVRERVISLDDLLRAEAVFVCNSVRGLRPVARLAVLEGEGKGLKILWTSTQAETEEGAVRWLP